MGGCLSREGSWWSSQTPFREVDSCSWIIDARHWKNHVERTYTQELLQSSGVKGSETVDGAQLRQELAGDQEIAGAPDSDDYFAGRAVYLGEKFVSWGQIWVPKKAWEGCEGAWVSRDAAFGSGHAEEFRLKRTEEGVLLCTATGVRCPESCEQNAPLSQQKAPFTGQAFRLGDADRGAGEGAEQAQADEELPAKQAADGDQSAVGEAEKHQAAEESDQGARAVWRLSPNGAAELNVSKGTGAAEDWQPCNIRFGDDFSTLNVEQSAGSDCKKVGTFERRVSTSTEQSRGRFVGIDLLFDARLENTSGSEDMRYVALHYAGVNEQQKLLQIVYSYGSPGRAQPGSLSVPIPEERMAEVRQMLPKWSKYFRPLEHGGRVYSTEEEFADSMATWLMMDAAVTMTCCAVLFASMDTCYCDPMGPVGMDQGFGGDGGMDFDD